MGNVYMCIDLKSFYASVECVARGYDPFKVPLVVADPTRGDGLLLWLSLLHSRNSVSRIAAEYMRFLSRSSMR